MYSSRMLAAGSGGSLVPASECKCSYSFATSPRQPVWQALSLCSPLSAKVPPPFGASSSCQPPALIAMQAPSYGAGSSSSSPPTTSIKAAAPINAPPVTSPLIPGCQLPSPLLPSGTAVPDPTSLQPRRLLSQSREQQLQHSTDVQLRGSIPTVPPPLALRVTVSSASKRTGVGMGDGKGGRADGGGSGVWRKGDGTGWEQEGEGRTGEQHGGCKKARLGGDGACQSPTPLQLQRKNGGAALPDTNRLAGVCRGDPYPPSAQPEALTSHSPPQFLSPQAAPTGNTSPALRTHQPAATSATWAAAAPCSPAPAVTAGAAPPLLRSPQRGAAGVAPPHLHNLQQLKQVSQR